MEHAKSLLRSLGEQIRTLKRNDPSTADKRTALIIQIKAVQQSLQAFYNNKKEYIGKKLLKYEYFLENFFT